MGESLTAALSAMVNWLSTTGIKIVAALVILLISFRIISVLGRKWRQRLEQKSKLDKTVSSVILNCAQIVAKIIVVIGLVGWLGIDTGGLTALVASLGVCAGLAVNGALSNLAGGVLILVSRPFKIGDYIEAQGYAGVVEDIRIVSTKLCTLDNKVVFLPNGALSSGSIVNYSEKKERRVDLDFTVDYASDFRKVEEIILSVCKANDKILSEPAPFVRVKSHGQSGIVIVTRAWTTSENYWSVYFSLLEDVKSAFDKEGISIPYQQIDVHLDQK